MAGQQPERKFMPIEFGGVLDESLTPAKVVGLTQCLNLIYRRFNSWGKRSGSTLVYVANVPSSGPPTPPPPPPPFSPPPTKPPAPPGPPHGTPQPNRGGGSNKE